MKKRFPNEDCKHFIEGACNYSSNFCWRLHRPKEERELNPLPIGWGKKAATKQS